jgi:hypothetical protein
LYLHCISDSVQSYSQSEDPRSTRPADL